MSRAGTSAFDNPDRYRAQFREADIDLIFTAPGDFKGRLTWVELPHLSLLATQETVSRIASISFKPGRAYISFPSAVTPGTIWNGVELRSNEIILHRPGSRTHDRGTNTNRWSFISIEPSHLHAVGTAIAGQGWDSPASDLILQPPKPAATRLRRLHGKACKLAETNPSILMHREVNRAIEQELIRVLIECISARGQNRNTKTLGRHIEIMRAFEDALCVCIERDVLLSDLFDAVGVPERTLRLCCGRFLGMGPRRYLQIRRLNKARAALQDADPENTHVAEIAHRYRFSELGRFAAAYRTLFGEMPSSTLRRARAA
jgi:AraC-like DNA-binding protein